MNTDSTKNTSASCYDETIQTALTAHKSGHATKKLYKALSDEHKTQKLQEDIAIKTDFLFKANKRSPVDFNNLQDVQQRTEEYLTACASVGAFPSVMGLANFAFGTSRQRLYWWLKHHPDSETSKFIDCTRDVIADILASAALQRNADAVMSIFILKNNHGFADRVEIEPVTQQSTEPVLDREELLKRYEL